MKDNYEEKKKLRNQIPEFSNRGREIRTPVNGFGDRHTTTV